MKKDDKNVERKKRKYRNVFVECPPPFTKLGIAASKKRQLDPWFLITFVHFGKDKLCEGTQLCESLLLIPRAPNVLEVGIGHIRVTNPQILPTLRRVLSKQARQRLLSKVEATTLATQVRKLDPHRLVLLGRHHQGAHLQNSLPHLHIPLASKQSLHPGGFGEGLRLGVIVTALELNDLLQLGKHLHPHNHAIFKER